MDCKEVRSLADSYLSEQLLVETTHGVVQHIERCPACRAELEARRRLRDTLRSAFEHAPDLQPADAFLDALAARVRAEAVSIRPRPKWRAWLAVAAGVMVMVGLGAATTAWLAQAGLAELAHLAAGDHQNCALKFMLPERPITLTEAAQRFDAAFGPLERVTFPATTAGNHAIEFVERHACVYNGQPFAHIVVRYRGVPVSLLIADVAGSGAGWWQGTTAAARVLAPAGGFTLASFRSARRSVFVVSTLPPEAVMELAAAVTPPITEALTGLEAIGAP